MTTTPLKVITKAPEEPKKSVNITTLQAMLDRLMVDRSKSKAAPEVNGPVATPVGVAPASEVKAPAKTEKTPSYIPPPPSQVLVETPMGDDGQGAGFGGVETIRTFIDDQRASVAPAVVAEPPESGQAEAAKVPEGPVQPAPEEKPPNSSGLVRGMPELVGFPPDKSAAQQETAEPEPQGRPAQQNVTINVDVSEQLQPILARLAALEDSNTRAKTLEAELEGTRRGATFRQCELVQEAAMARMGEKSARDALGTIVGAFSEALGNAEAAGVVTQPLPEAKNGDLLAPLKGFLGMVVEELSERLPKKGELERVKGSLRNVITVMGEAGDLVYGRRLDSQTGFENALGVLSLSDAVAEMSNREKHALPEDDGTLCDILSEVVTECDALLSMANPSESDVKQNRVAAFVIDRHGLPADMGTLAPVIKVLRDAAESVSDSLAERGDSENGDDA